MESGSRTLSRVQLFSPVSLEEATALENGALTDGPLFWTDRPQYEEAEPDAVWVVLEAPDAELTAFEGRHETSRGYRQFELPAEVARTYPVRRLPRG